ncbi:helix-turn-helix domain-containing protein [Chitinophaga sp. sic0106]|uniref:helix-turn-helix domain-containing protein n=1 Tax=Chitinophaga sp. sic0106 TaxID=2854785 RepID=UPI001C45F7B6|nr:AraC family transcriptional regulator [Chitinophaga sp. sic0106]MBV7529630.1 AraC family transcriptional regulator [Chitinophaga sp. sic0106]
MGKRLLKHSFSLLHVDHVHLDTRWNYKHVISPYYRLYYIDEGEGTISGPAARIKLSPGNLYLIPSFTLCNLHCSAYLSQYFVQFFEEAPDGLSLFYNKRVLMKKAATPGDISNIKRLLQLNPNRGINRSDNPRVYEKDAFYREYQELNNLQSDAVYLETQGILLQLLSRFMDQQSQAADEGHVIPSKIMDTISYIQLHLKEPLTVAFLASRVNHNQDYFSRQFLQFTGLRPLHYMHEKRIERAQYLIATTDAGYTEIAAEVGFDNLPHFSKVFRKVTGMTPNKYRQQNRVMNTI